MTKAIASDNLHDTAIPERAVGVLIEIDGVGLQTSILALAIVDGCGARLK